MKNHHENKIKELRAKIVQNERMRDKAYQLKPLLTDRNALSQCDTEIKECQKYIDYFNDELAKMESRKDSDSSLHDTAYKADHHNTPHEVGHNEGRDIKKYSTLGIYFILDLKTRHLKQKKNFLRFINY